MCSAALLVRDTDQREVHDPEARIGTAVNLLAEAIRGGQNSRRCEKLTRINPDLGKWWAPNAEGVIRYEPQKIKDYVNDIEYKLARGRINELWKEERLNKRDQQSTRESVWKLLKDIGPKPPAMMQHVASAEGELIEDDAEQVAEINRYWGNVWAAKATEYIPEISENFDYYIGEKGQVDFEFANEVDEQDLEEIILAYGNSAPGPDGR